MDASLIALLAAVGVFLVLTIVGLVFLVLRMQVLARASMKLQGKVSGHLADLTEKQEAAMEKLALLETRQQDLTTGAAKLTTEMQRLGLLLNELSAARAILRNPFPGEL